MQDVFKSAWDWIGAEIYNFGIRWILFITLGVVVALIFRTKNRRELDAIKAYLGIEHVSKGIRPKALLRWLKPAAKPPKTKTWIDKNEALSLARNSSIVLKKSPSRKKAAKTAFDKMFEQIELAAVMKTVEPSGEIMYKNKFENEVSAALLDNIISKYPHAERNGKYSKEIIAFELCQITLKSALQ